MEEDIQNYSPTVMFCGTPCRSLNYLPSLNYTYQILICSFAVHAVVYLFEGGTVILICSFTVHSCVFIWREDGNTYRTQTTSNTATIQVGAKVGSVIQDLSMSYSCNQLNYMYYVTKLQNYRIRILLDGRQFGELAQMHWYQVGWNLFLLISFLFLILCWNKEIFFFCTLLLSSWRCFGFPFLIIYFL